MTMCIVPNRTWLKFYGPAGMWFGARCMLSIAAEWGADVTQPRICCGEWSKRRYSDGTRVDDGGITFVRRVNVVCPHN